MLPAARSDAVLDHELLAQILGEFLAEDTGDDVCGAAWRKADDHLHRLVGIGLGRDG